MTPGVFGGVSGPVLGESGDLFCYSFCAHLVSLLAYTWSPQGSTWPASVVASKILGWIYLALNLPVASTMGTITRI